MDKQEYLKLRKSLVNGRLLKKSNVKPIIPIFLEIVSLSMIIAGLIYLEAFSLGFWVLEALLGLNIFRCFVLTHECGHGTLFKTPWLNTSFGSLFGCICGVPFICWRNAHFEHHKWVGVVDKDPTSEGLLSVKQYSKVQRLMLTIIWKVRIPLAALGGVLMAFWLYPFKQFKKRNLKNAKLGAASVVFTALILGLTIYQLGSFCLVYLLPAYLFFYVFFECINLTHHSGLYPFVSSSHPEPVPLYGQDAHCRTALMPAWVSAMTCYHFNLHTEHHLFPTIPWHNLPRVQGYLRDAKSGTFNNVKMLSFMEEIRAQDPFEAFVDSVPNKTT